MIKHSFLLWVVTASLFISCKKSDDPAPIEEVPKYFMISSNQAFKGSVSVYSAGVYTGKSYFVNQSPYQDRIADAVISGDKMYAVRAVSSLVDVIDVASMTLIKSVPFAKQPSGNYFRQIDFSNNKIIVSDRGFIPDGSFDDESFLKIIDPDNGKVDSVPIVKNSAILAMAQLNGKIFISRQMQDYTLSILVLDAATYAIIKDINLGEGYSTDLLFDREDNLLVFSRGKIIIISTTDYVTIKTKLIGGTSVNYSFGVITNSVGFCIDKENNIVYFLRQAAQPASAPYIFSSYNIVSDDVRTLNVNFINASTMAYDKKKKLILMGDISGAAGAIKLYNTDGSLSSKIDVPSIPSDILIK
jgi:hypothetical protein